MRQREVCRDASPHPGVDDDSTVRTRDYIATDWPSVWSIFREVVTASFMVAGDARGQGIGRALGEYPCSWAQEQGYPAMQFNAVVESNHAAVRLWQALGFHVIETVPEAFAHPALGRVGLHVMYRRL